MVRQHSRGIAHILSILHFTRRGRARPLPVAEKGSAKDVACPRLRRALQVFLWQTLQRSKKSRKAQARRFFWAPQQERRPRQSVQVWRYLRSKLTALSRQGKLELTRRWRVWSATNNGFHAVTPHPSGFACHLLPLEKADNVHRFSTDGMFAIIFKTALFFGLLMKATSLVAFPCEGRGTTKWWMSSIRDRHWGGAPTVGAGALDSPSKFGGICVAN